MTSRFSTFLILLLTSFSLQAQVSAFLDVDITEGCETLSVTTTNTLTPLPIDSIILDYGDGTADTIINPTSGYNTIHNYDTIGDFTIILTAYKDVNSDSDSKIVHIYPYPNANFTYQLYGYSGGENHFYFSNKKYLFIADYPNDTTHIWSVNNELRNSITDSMGYNFKTIGIQNITHIITIKGCSDTSSLALNITEQKTKIPNIFSPNGDGINDVFYIQTDGEMIYEFTVLDRNGSRVFVSEGRIISWDGRTYWGEQLHPGNYYFSLKPSSGETITGIIYLAR